MNANKKMIWQQKYWYIILCIMFARVSYTAVSALSDILMNKYSHITYRAPPQSIRIGGKLLVELVLHKVDEERREDENQETDVPRCDQLLKTEVEGSGPCYMLTLQFNIAFTVE